jgi:hypothetical protein
MSLTKRALLLLTIGLIIMGGCTQLADLWPAKQPRDLLQYTDTDPNQVLNTLGMVKELREVAVTKHIVQQLDYKHEMEKDKALYGRAIEQAELNITIAQNERSSMIGTLENPGWLLGALLGMTGVGAYLVGSRQQRPEDWTEAEHQEALAQAVAAVKKG